MQYIAYNEIILFIEAKIDRKKSDISISKVYIL